MKRGGLDKANSNNMQQDTHLTSFSSSEKALPWHH